MGNGPLADSRLQEIESKLNAGRFDEAQRLLSTIGNLPNAETASAYFATRLLYQRGRMDKGGVIERLRDLLARAPDFPEAARMLAAAEAGVLEPAPDVFRRVTAAPEPEPEAVSEPAPTRRAPTQRDIPRAPLVPRFTPRTGTPSNIPSTPLAPRDDESPALPVIPALNTLRGVGPTAPTPVVTTSISEREKLPTVSAPADSNPDVPIAAPVAPPAPALPFIPSLQIPTINTVSTLPPPNSEPPPPTAQAKPRSGSYSVRPQTPSLFEIAAELDAGRAARALELTEQAAAADNGPQLGMLSARALVALGDRGRAIAQVERVLRGKGVDASVRATAARLLMDLGRVDAALEHARRALREEPNDALVKVTCACALVRTLRRRGQRSLAAEAEALIENVRMREGPIAALLLGLRAALAAESKDATRALSLAQSAIALDARQADAIAAIALASAVLGKPAEAEKAQRRLREIAPDEAVANESALARHGAELHADGSDAPEQGAWGEVENALCAGKSEPALETLRKAASDCVRNNARRAGPEAWQSLASQAARSFTELPVFRHFAPYDCSVFSVDRLEAALALMLGDTPGPVPVDEQVVLLLGAYVGESWRQAFGAEWQGTPNAPYAATIEGIGLHELPCERVRERLQRGVPLAIETPHALHPGADPFGNSVPLSIVPPAPWDPQAYPDLAEFCALGRNLASSVIGLYCERGLGLPLDLSISGTVAIDRYVALLAPAKAPPDPEAGWSRRVALLLGAYLGEVLVEAVGASWESRSEIRALDEYRLLLPRGAVATPVTRVLERFAGRRATPLSEYVARLASGRTSVSA
ncbi:MAG: hypothetical protein ACOY0T_37230 [Myxococcota bacterium]